MRIKENVSYRAFKALDYFILGLIALICLYPMLYVLFAALSEPARLSQHRGLLLKPLGFTFRSIVQSTKHPLIVPSYINTLLVLVGGLATNLICTVTGAYILSVKDFPLRKIMNKLIVFTMLFSGGIIPLYITVKSVGILYSYWSLILPTAINTFNLIILRTAFDNVPDALVESARLDGANDLIILFRIVLPLCMPTFAVIILYYGVGHWNSWFNAMMFLGPYREKYPLSLILREILIQNDTSSMTGSVNAIDAAGLADTVKYSIIIISTLPILCAYPFLQKYFVKGVMVGAVKG